MNWGGKRLSEIAKDPEDEIWFDADFKAYLDEAAKGNHIEALEWIQLVLERFPTNATAFFAEAYTLGELNFLDKAVVAYHQAIRIRPDYAAAWNNLGVVYGKQGKFAEEINAYRQAIRITLDYGEAWNNMADTCTQHRQYDTAWDAVRHLEKLDPNRASKLAEALRILAR